MKLFSAAIALLGATCAFAQSDTKREPIETDRPDFTESGKVVGFRTMQLEMGMTYQWSRQAFTFSGPETLFRIGTSNTTEFRIGIPDMNWQRAGGVWQNGFGDTNIGMKFLAGPLKNGDDFAIIVGANVPSRDTNFSSGSVDPEIKFCWGHDLKNSWGGSAMVSGLYTTDAQGRLLVLQQTVSFDRELSERLAMFIEYAGNFSARSVPDHIAHVGLIFMTSPDVTFDIHAGFSMNGGDRQPFLGAGYSVRY